MPTHTAASALVKMYALNEAPWKWTTWQELTGIRHGLFPDDEKKLPHGWTVQNAIDVQSYFRAYQLQPTEEKKIAFAVNTRGTSAYPGREFWNSYIQRWWPTWGVHNIIVEALREWEIHPLTILARENDLKAPWPTADFYVPLVLDPVALRLLGEEAFPDGSTILTTELRRCVQILVQRSWNSLRSQISMLRNRPNEIEATALAAFKDLETGKPTKAKVSRAIRAVAKWKECAELFNTHDNMKKAEDMLAELQAILESLGAKLRKPAQRKGICKVSTVDLKSLATEEDVGDLLNLYDEYFGQNVDDEELPAIPEAPLGTQMLDDTGGDFGMEEEAKMTPASLALSLGFRTGLPPSFNRYRHRSGVTPWDDAELFKKVSPDQLPAYLFKLNLHWHQLAGVHSMTRSTFTKERTEDFIAGVLVGDEVGLGKSAQAIAFISFLGQAIYRQQALLNPPKILKDQPYLAGKEKIPSLPHLIVCPGTLVAQWVNELKTFLLPKSVDIFVYDSQTDGAEFWGPNGALARSKHKAHNRIIVASHSALFKDLNKNHYESKKKNRNARPWDMPDAKGSLENTIFGQQYLTVVIDEAHNMRNPGKKHTAALRLLQQATMRIIMTATPLHTSSKDIGAMGRLVGIPYFFSEVSFEEERNDTAAVRRAKKLDDDGEGLLAVQLQTVKRLQSHLAGHFLRRTTDSRDYEGKILLPLPPYKEIIGILKLTERETEIIQERAEAAKEAMQLNSRTDKLSTKPFYLEYRLAVAYAKENAGDLWPTFGTLEEWLEAKGTKMDVLAQICAHYLTHDDVDDISFADGVPIFPEIPAIPEEQVKKTRRIIIYSEFVSMTPLLQNVLRLYGIDSLAINGKLSFDNRDKQVKYLYDDNHPARVLIFSSVGSAGLNLSIADIVFFFVQPWSAQDERQIRGRAWRQPQTKIVKAIHLLAQDSADLLMNDVARSKRDMFDAFVNKELGEELARLIRGHAVDVADDADAADGADDTGAKAAPKRRRKSKKRDAPVVVDEEPVEPGQPADTTASDGDVSMHTSDGDLSMQDSEPDSFSDVPPSTLSEEADEDDRHADFTVAMQKGPGPYKTQQRRPMISSDDEEEPVTVAGPRDLSGVPRSTEGSEGDSPPAKRARKGTIGSGGRAGSLAAQTLQEGQDETAVLQPGSSSVMGRDNRGSSSTMTTKAQPLPNAVANTLKRSMKPNPFSKTAGSTGKLYYAIFCTHTQKSGTPHRATASQPNPFARTPAPSGGQREVGGSGGPRPSTSTSGVSSASAVPSRVPSRMPGPLEQVSVPPKSALAGSRSSKKGKRS